MNLKMTEQQEAKLLRDVKIQKDYYKALQGVCAFEEAIMGCKKPSHVLPLLMQLDDAFAQVQEAAEAYRESLEAALTIVIRTDMEPS